jgi:hypothetical protein
VNLQLVSLIGLFIWIEGITLVIASKGSLVCRVPAQKFCTFLGRRQQAIPDGTYLAVYEERNVVRVIHAALQVIIDIDGIAILEGEDRRGKEKTYQKGIDKFGHYFSLF